MKKIGILTFQNTLNYGAVLQNYALFYELKNLGFDVAVINYRLKKIEQVEHLALCRRPAALIKYPFFRIKAGLFRRFKKNMGFTESCDRDTVAKIEKEFDYLIVGSDQVWNTKITVSDPTYFLDFIDDPRRCKTYAVSMGYTELPPCDFDPRPLISHFSSILVREKSAAETIAKECPDAPMPYVVLDPTLLVEKKVWDEMQKTPRYTAGTPYILVYTVSEAESAFEAARKLHADSGARIIRIQAYGVKPMRGAKCILNVSPEEYLGLFAHAQATVVSSFHGLCFSIINHRDFYFSGQTSGKNTNSRATDLMDALGISGRTVQDLANGTVKPVDWDDVEARLSALRAESLRLLKESLVDVEGR